MKTEWQINNDTKIDIKAIKRALMYATSCLQDGIYNRAGFPVVRCVTHMSAGNAKAIARNTLGPDADCIQFMSWGCHDLLFAGHTVLYVVCSSGHEQFWRVFNENFARLRYRDCEGDHNITGQSIDYIV